VYLLRDLTAQRLSVVCQVPVQRLLEIARNPRPHYRVKEEGKRIYHIPSRELKRVQRLLLRRLFRPIPPHHSSACVRGRGTPWVYQRHLRHPCLLQLDLKSFFPSVKMAHLIESLAARGVEGEAAEVLAGLVILPDRLPQGAPTSVEVSDLVLGRLDGRLEGMARGRGFTYSRYVDDITLSGGSRLKRAEGLVRRIITDCGWALNEKGGFVGPSQRHAVLGAVINRKPNVSRQYFSELRSLLRLASMGAIRLTDEELSRLRGRVQWVVHINPERGRRLLPLLAETEALATAQGDVTPGTVPTQDG